jgi:hypothetical protein
MLIPSKFEYVPATQIAGMARDFTTKIEIAQTVNGWMALVHITSSPSATSAAEVQRKLRDELLRVAEILK